MPRQPRKNGVTGTLGPAIFASALLALVAACENAQPPEACGAIPAVTLNTGETAAATACFNDPNGDMLGYVATSSNPAVATASISGTSITIRAVAPGNASVTITATDVGGLQGQQSFQVTVPNRPPHPTGTIPSMTVTVGKTGTLDASGFFSEPDGEALSYGAQSSDPAVATVSVAGSTVTVTAVAKGATMVTVTATDPGGLSATQTFQALVPNRSPVPVGTIPDETVGAGSSVNVNLTPYFEDPDGDPLSYTAMSSNTGVVAASVTGSTLTVAGAAKGTVTVTVTAMDTEGLEATQTFRTTVPNRPPSPTDAIPDHTIRVGETVTIDLSNHFDDPDGDALTYAATTTNSGMVRMSVSGSNVAITAVAKGTANVTVSATDDEGLAATQTFRSVVPNQAPEPISMIPDQTAHVNETVTLHLSTYFEDPDGDALTYHAMSSNSGVARASQAGSTLTITAVALGEAVLTVTASDGDGASATQRFDFDVVETNRSPRPVGSIPALALVAGGTETINASGYFTDPDGDPLTYTATSSSIGVASVVVTGSTVTIMAHAAGSATVTVTASDPGGLAAQQNVSVTVDARSRDREALMALYDGTNGDFWWDIDTSWGSDQPLGTWYGVTTDDDERVIELSLPDNTVLGEIPRELGHLQRLKVLDLSENRIRGALPVELGELENLEELYLGDNIFLGSQTSIPAALGKLNKLRVLDLSGTRFRNEIPRELGNLSSLTRLDFAEIPWLDGSFPPEFGQLHSLRELDVTNSGMDGALPQTLINVPLELFHWTGTRLCSPNNQAFQAWLVGISDQRGESTCGPSTGGGFRDDFNTSASLQDWTLSRATAVVTEGVLELTKTTGNFLGTAQRTLGAPIRSWTLDTRMGRERTANSSVGLIWRTGHSRYTEAFFYIGLIRVGGTNANYAVLLYDSEDERLYAVPDAWGNSSAINDGAGEMTRIQLSSINRRFKGVAGDTELFNGQLSLEFAAVFGQVHAVWLVSQGASGRTMLFDWIEADGTEASNLFVDGELPDAGRIDRLELRVPVGRSVSVRSLKSLRPGSPNLPSR